MQAKLLRRVAQQPPHHTVLRSSDWRKQLDQVIYQPTNLIDEGIQMLFLVDCPLSFLQPTGLLLTVEAYIAHPLVKRP
jgi:hypothetical protein